MPRARATLHLTDSPATNAPIEAPIEALGYVERLDLTLFPWRLPIDTLRWGRFVSPTRGLVWIQWLGPTPRDLLFQTTTSTSSEPAAREPHRPTITDTHISADDGATTLELANPRTLRDGPLGATALAGIPAIHRLIPAPVLDTHETKWLSRATLRTAIDDNSPHAASEGWAIHEAVHLGRRPHG